MILDYSRITCYQSCPRRYFYKYVEPIRKIKYEEQDLPKEFGSAIHKALELRDNKQNYLNYFETNFKELPGNKLYTVSNGLQLLNEYIKWESLNFPELKVLATEIEGSFKIGDYEYKLRIDRIVELNSNIYVWDYKTTTKKGYLFFNKFDPSTQVSGYCKWCVDQYGQCSGFIPIQISLGYREKKYKGEPAGFHCDFAYEIINRNKEQIEDFEKNVKQVGWKLGADYKTGYWTKSEDSCGWCEYRDLCRSLEDEGVKDNLYEEVGHENS